MTVDTVPQTFMSQAWSTTKDLGIAAKDAAIKWWNPPDDYVEPTIDKIRPEILIPFMASLVEAALDPQVFDREGYFEARTITLLSKRLELGERMAHGQAQKRAHYEQQGQEYLTLTKKEMRGSAKTQENWANRGQMAALVGTTLPLFIITERVMGALKGFRFIPEFLRTYIPGNQLEIDNLKKQAQTLGQGIPQWANQQAEVAKTLGQAEQYGGQLKTDVHMKKAEAAAGAQSELTQQQSRDMESMLAAVRTWGEIARALASAA